MRLRFEHLRVLADDEELFLDAERKIHSITPLHGPDVLPEANPGINVYPRPGYPGVMMVCPLKSLFQAVLALHNAPKRENRLELNHCRRNRAK